jgi:hypothetical protein
MVAPSQVPSFVSFPHGMARSSAVHVASAPATLQLAPISAQTMLKSSPSAQ